MTMIWVLVGRVIPSFVVEVIAMQHPRASSIPPFVSESLLLMPRSSDNMLHIGLSI
jgi:hypothetical protein